MIVGCALLVVTALAPSATEFEARGVVRSLLERLEATPPRERGTALESFLEQHHTAILADAPDGPTAARRRTQLLIALGALFDVGNVLSAQPWVGSRFAGLVPADARKTQRQVVSSLRFDGRRDAAVHFFLSAALTATIGPALTERVGRQKELADARRLQSSRPSGAGFSFVDLAYDHAGIRYARWLLGDGDLARRTASPPPLPRFAPSFAALALPEGLTRDAFQERYGGDRHGAYLAWIEKIHAHLDRSLSTP